MEQSYGGRYAARGLVQTMPAGHLYEAEDLSLSRRVLVYVPADKFAAAETRTEMLRAARFTHDDFMHVLDVGMSLGNPYAVFKWCEGSPLVQQLPKHRMSADALLASVFQLGQAMQEAAEDGTFGYSVLADNLWLGHAGRLLPIRYWEAAADRAKGAAGLCSLFIQLSTKEEKLPETFDMAEQRLRLALHELPAARLEAVVSLVARTFRVKLPLTAFLSELRLCLSNSSLSSPAAAAGSRLPQAAAVPAAEPALDDEHPDTAEADILDDEEDIPSGRGRVWRRLALIAGAACLFVIVFIGVLTFVFHLGGRNGDLSETKPQQKDAAVKTPPAASPSSSSPAPPEPADPAAVKKSADSGGAASGPTTIPKLLGLPRADAEKAALAAGLHYTFYLESNDAPQGTVFKQDPQSGAAAVRGDSVTFWVSKGK